MPDDNDLFDALRDHARDLDPEARPITAEEAMARLSSRGAWYQRRPALLAAAAALVLVVGVGAWLASRGEDRAQVVAPGPDDSTTSTAPPPDAGPAALVRGVDTASLPAAGIAVVDGDTVALYGYDGKALGSGPFGLTANGPALEVAVGMGGTVRITEAPPDPAQIPTSCTSAAAGGGLHVAVCGEDRVISAVNATNQTVLAEAPPAGGPTGRALGRWRWVIPSPDGASLVAQWSGECESPTGFLFRADGSGAQTVTTDPLARWADAPASLALGWSPDHRAVFQVLGEGCGNGGTPGVYLLDPRDPSGGYEPIRTVPGNARAYLWTQADGSNPRERLLSRAIREALLSPCCGEPDHSGTGSVSSGVTYDGYDIAVSGAPTSAGPIAGVEKQRMPLGPGEASIILQGASGDPGQAVELVAFTCGDTTWLVTWTVAETTPEIDSMLLLAEELLPHLYCTLGPPPPVTGK